MLNEPIESPPLPPRAHDTLQPLEPVTLIDGKNRRYLHFLTPKSRFHSSLGYINTDELIGQAPGLRVETSTGHVMGVYRTTYEEYVLLMKRAAQVIPPKDIPYIVQWADIFYGATVVEAGLGSGGLTMALLRAVGPQGKVIAFDLREDHTARGLKNIAAWSEGLEKNLEVHHGDVHAGLADLTSIDRIVLDLPEPWDVLPNAAKALKPGAIILTYLPTIRQVDRFVLTALDSSDFGEPDVCEVLVRPWVADKMRLRPTLRMAAHSGFLVRCRRRGPKLQITYPEKKPPAPDGLMHEQQPVLQPDLPAK